VPITGSIPSLSISVILPLNGTKVSFGTSCKVAPRVTVLVTWI
jgi:hypothetical protein